ncbi:hypothetical protein BgiBS90_012057, partial [Biomphalaria glabrata]
MRRLVVKAISITQDSGISLAVDQGLPGNRKTTTGLCVCICLCTSVSTCTLVIRIVFTGL